MNRRHFLRNGLIGMGLSQMPLSLLRAQEAAPQPTVKNIVPAAQTAVLGLPIKASIQPLLARAKAAMDAHADRIALRDRVALADFSVASSEHRFHIVDLTAGEAISYLVAHGSGSDPGHSGYLQSFSNQPNSMATSEGAFLPVEVYDGTHGAAMRLLGLDVTNDNAEMRAIVVHSAPYVSEDHVAVWGKAGRSNGCFVVAPHLITQVLGQLGPGRLLYSAKV